MIIRGKIVGTADPATVTVEGKQIASVDTGAATVSYTHLTLPTILQCIERLSRCVGFWRRFVIPEK